MVLAKIGNNILLICTFLKRKYTLFKLSSHALLSFRYIISNEDT